MKRLASLASSTVRVHLSCTSPAIGCESEVSLLAQFSFDMTHQFHSRSIATVASTPTSAMYPVALSHIASPSPISPACSFPTPFFPKIRGLLVDAAGTLLVPSEPAAAVYRRYAAHYAGGASPLLSEQEVLHRFRKAYNSKWCGSSIRYVGDGRPFWHHIVSESTGCSSTEMFEQIYEYYERPEAWKITPGAVQALHKLRSRGIKLAVVSNFDTRLRPLLQALQLSSLFDQIIVSAEVGVEKPCPLIFEEACEKLALDPHEVVHLGDDRRNDVWGARDAGITAWLWGTDVMSFEEVAEKVLTGDRQV